LFVHAANIPDRDGAEEVLLRMVGCFGRLKLIWADSSYAGELVEWTRSSLGRVIQIVRKRVSHAFEVLPKRWIVERTFAWLGRYRRLSKDYETLPVSSEAMIYIAMINLMLHRLQPG
jgi:putative transposase